MSKIWRLCPRRGKKSILQKKNIAPARGELIMEMPDNGEPGPVSFKVGDGQRAYNSLPYAFGEHVISEKINQLMTGLATKLSTKSDTNHTHNYAASYHTHDDRYFTESEMNTKLSGKADSNQVEQLVTLTSGSGTVNIEYLNSDSICKWYKFGRLCNVQLVFKARKQFTDLCLLFSGLPGALFDQDFFYPAIQSDGVIKNGNFRMMANGELHEFYYYKPTLNVNVKTSFVYITKS